MAEYGRAGSAADYMAEIARRDPNYATAQNPAKSSIIHTKITRKVEVDFGNAPYTLDQIRQFVEETADLPGGATLGVNAGDSQRDGSWFKITVTGG